RDCCRLKADECVAAWGDKKERVLIDCVHASEDNSNRARQENTKLVELQHVVIGDENTCMRDILKQVVAKASAEYECVRVSKAATQGSLRELNSCLAAMTTTSVSQRWMVYKPRTPSSRRRYSIGETGKLMTGFS
ncbi:hypothetical protein ACJX0J_036671, partial [Zea mays]